MDGDSNKTIAWLAGQMRRNSERWFPQIHDGHLDMQVFYTLGLAGEVGEVANEVKKIIREANNPDQRRINLGEELADVFTYLLLLADELNVDLVAEYQKKVETNEARWG